MEVEGTEVVSGAVTGAGIVLVSEREEMSVNVE